MMSTTPAGSWPLVLSMAVVAPLGVVYLAEAAGEHDGVSRMDPVAAADVLGLRTPFLTGAAHVATFLGGEIVVGALAIAVFAVLLARRDLTRAVTFAVGIGGSAFLTVALKLWVRRPRPGRVDRLGALDTSYSFPSGHTLNSAVFLALCLWLLWPPLSTATRTVLVTGSVVLAVAVGTSRVYLGYHWLTDVLASWLVAIAWLSLVWLLRGRIAAVVTTAADRLLPRGPQMGPG